MSSLMWYIYDFARKAWAQGFTNAKTSPEIVEKPSRFRNLVVVLAFLHVRLQMQLN